MEYFVLFALLIAIFLSLHAEDQPQNTQLYEHKSLTILLIGYLILLAAFRDGEYMPDYAVYVKKFLLEARGERTDLEPSFMVISKISNFVYPESPYVMFLIYASLGVYLKIIALRKIASFFFLSLVVYISNFYILLEMIQIRIGVASAIILLSFIPLYQRRLRSFLLYIVVATFFHFSSLYAILLWFLNPYTFSKKKFFAIIISAYLFYIIGEVVLGAFLNELALLPLVGKVAVYAMVAEEESMIINPFGLYAITRLIVVTFFIAKSEKLLDSCPIFPLIIKIYTLGVASYIGFAIFPNIAYRLGQLFMLTEIFLIPMLVYAVNRRSLGKLYVIGWSLLTFVMNVCFTTFFKFE